MQEVEEVEDFFWEVTDFQVEGRCLHELSDISWLVLCGLLADGETVEELYDYACDKQAVLAQFLNLPVGIPCPYTLQRVFAPSIRSSWKLVLLVGARTLCSY